MIEYIQNKPKSIQNIISVLIVLFLVVLFFIWFFFNKNNKDGINDIIDRK